MSTTCDNKAVIKLQDSGVVKETVYVKERENSTRVSSDTSSSLEAGFSEDDEDTEGYDKTLQWSPEEERTIIRKLDTHFLPLILLMSFVLNMDRTNLSNAISDNLASDLGITNDDVNTTIQVYAVLFTIFALPSNFVVKRIGAHLWIPIMMNAWGAVTWGHALLHNFGGLIVVRILIAITEAGFNPAVVYYMTGFYKGRELASRLAWFWGLQSLASAFSGLISFGVFKLAGTAGLEGWKWLFLIDGISTHVVAIFALFYLPTRPSRTKGILRGRKGWFTERETAIAVTRLIRDDESKTEQSTRITWQDVKLCLSDTKIWVHLLATFTGYVTISPIHTYLPSIIRDAGFSADTANLLTVPAYVINVVFSIIVAWSSDRHGEVCLHTMISNVWLLGSIIAMRVMPPTAGRWSIYGAAMMAVAAPSWHGMHVAYMTSNIAPTGKRAVAIGMMIAAANLCAVPGARIYQTWDAPRYYFGNSINIGLVMVVIILFLTIRFRYIFANRWRASKWDSMSKEEKKHYLTTTSDIGSLRLDYRYRI